METVVLCDLCLSDSRQSFAKAVYWNEAGEEWHACSKHLKGVVAAGLEYELLEEGED